VQGFWHLQMQPGNVYDKSSDFPLHVTHAVIDTKDLKGKGDEDFIQVRVVHGQAPKAKEITVANLSVKHSIMQAPVDLSFGPSDMVKFRLTGAKIPVTLVGVMERVEEMSDDEDDDSEEEEDFEVDPQDIVRGKRKAGKMNGVAGKKARLDTTDQLLQQIKDDQSIVEESGDEEDYNPLKDEKMPKDPELDNLPAEEEELQAPTSSDDEDEDDDNEEDGDSDSEDEAEDEGTTLDDVDEFDSDDSDDESVDLEDDSDSEHSPEEASPVKPTKLSKQSTPKPTKAASPKSAKKDAKVEKSEKKLKPESTPKQIAVKKAATPKVGKEGTPKAKDSKDGKKGILKGTPEKLNASKLEGSAQKKDVQMRAGGVTIQDISEGSGPVVKSGSMVSMYYRGTLKNGKEFDSKQSGKPFKFRLGKGEVIQGWDVGVAGMKVGGRRKLSVPPKMGYGKAGAAPVIPPNAHLNFDVTLVGFN